MSDELKGIIEYFNVEANIDAEWGTKDLNIAILQKNKKITKNAWPSTLWKL